ncbi:LOW QUALITY PROTEIN: hypothetical protein BC938DRAFT_474419 [Jimgerdemannia flammicorona]|uniref:Cytochrome P450 n=1 Tax=Jimgerdemannia flammicorona TaxID=994334 RepID=A0A433QSI9_9FUNG|nr:LOW QUALITY PROTEIN: hypothetical protein BC938DRAFT_474419 [Jimgerdemannia flammicorona]
MANEFQRTMLDIVADVIGARSAPEEFMRSLTVLLLALRTLLVMVSFGGYFLRYVYYRRHIKMMDAFVYQNICERKSAKVEMGAAGRVKDEGKNESTKTMLDILLDVRDVDENRLSDDEVRDQLFTFFLVGEALVYRDPPRTRKTGVCRGRQHLQPDDIHALHFTQNCLAELCVSTRLVGQYIIDKTPTCTHSSRTYLKLPTKNFASPRRFPSSLHSPQHIRTHDFPVAPRRRGSSQYADSDLCLGMHRDPRFWDSPEEFLPDRWEREMNGSGYKYKGCVLT